MAEERNVAKQEQAPRPTRSIRPISTICECEGEVQLTVEMPGVTKDNLEIQVDNDQLIIRGRRNVQDVKGRYVIRERPVGDYYRSYTIDETVDRDKIAASMKNGVLALTLKLQEAAKPRKIQVKSS